MNDHIFCAWQGMLAASKAMLQRSETLYFVRALSNFLCICIVFALCLFDARNAERIWKHLMIIPHKPDALYVLFVTYVLYTALEQMIDV